MFLGGEDAPADRRETMNSSHGSRPRRGRLVDADKSSPISNVLEPHFMQMNDIQRVPASKAKVWAALNDPEILKQCIPGCQSLVMTSPTDMTATVVVKLGPVKATFSGKVTLSDFDPPNGYRISGEGSGGAAGFAKGGATIKLEAESGDVTNLRYVVDAHIGGKLAQLGGRLIDSTAKKLAEEFFRSLAAALTTPEQLKSGAAATATGGEPKKGWLRALISWRQVILRWPLIFRWPPILPPWRSRSE
jgi:carbon monoxide dehydrogenase subunit G